MCDTDGFPDTPNAALKSVHVKEWLAIGCSTESCRAAAQQPVCPSERENCICRRKECICAARLTCCEEEVYIPPIVNILRTSPEQLYSQEYTFPHRPSVEGALVNDGNGQLAWEPLPLGDAWNVHIGARAGDVLVFDGEKWTPKPNCCSSAPASQCTAQTLVWDSNTLMPRLLTEATHIDSLSLLILQAPVTQETIRCTILAVQLREEEYGENDDGLRNDNKYLERLFTDESYTLKTQMVIECTPKTEGQTCYTTHECVADRNDTTVQLPEHTLLFPILEGPEELKHCCTLSLTYSCLPEPVPLVPAPPTQVSLNSSLAAFGTPAHP